MNIHEVDLRRGHRFLPPQDELDRIPALYETEDVPLSDKMIYLHYFIGSCDWWIAELDPEQLLAFGYANLGDDRSAEWGYVSLGELGTLMVAQQVRVVGTSRVGQIDIPVERELGWTPTPFSQIQR